MSLSRLSVAGLTLIIAGCSSASPGVIGVAATTEIDTWASFSTYGDQVALAAPGKRILSAFPLSKSNGYRIII